MKPKARRPDHDLASARQTLQRAQRVLARLDSRAALRYQIDALARTMEADLGRLVAADVADDHAQWYRAAFGRAVARLWCEIDAADPDPSGVAGAALHVSYLAHIWPILSADRRGRHARNLGKANRTRKRGASDRAARCRRIASEMQRPTPGKVQRRYARDFPGEAAPGISTIRRYLAAR